MQRLVTRQSTGYFSNAEGGRNQFHPLPLHGALSGFNRAIDLLMVYLLKTLHATLIVNLSVFI
jgi:hypothetical protein